MCTGRPWRRLNLWLHVLNFFLRGSRISSCGYDCPLFTAHAMATLVDQFAWLTRAGVLRLCWVAGRQKTIYDSARHRKSTGSTGVLRNQPSNFLLCSPTPTPRETQANWLWRPEMEAQSTAEGFEELAIMTANRNKQAAPDASAKCTRKVKWRHDGKSCS